MTGLRAIRARSDRAPGIRARSDRAPGEATSRGIRVREGQARASRAGVESRERRQDAEARVSPSAAQAGCRSKRPARWHGLALSVGEVVCRRVWPAQGLCGCPRRALGCDEAFGLPEAGTAQRPAVPPAHVSGEGLRQAPWFPAAREGAWVVRSVRAPGGRDGPTARSPPGSRRGLLWVKADGMRVREGQARASRAGVESRAQAGCRSEGFTERRAGQDAGASVPRDGTGCPELREVNSTLIRARSDRTTGVRACPELGEVYSTLIRARSDRATGVRACPELARGLLDVDPGTE